jgi:pyruvate, orthophosphate dikinase
MSLAPEPSPGLYFVLPEEEPPAGAAAEVGNKAWNLMRLVAAGFTVPPAFVLPTAWYRRGAAADDPELRHVLALGIARLETASDLGFGSGRRPLLVSVRSGAAVSMPGMLETVLNVGLTPASLDGLIRLTGNPRLAWDSYRRLVQNYAEVVAGLPAAPFEALLAAELAKEAALGERALDFRAHRAVTQAMLQRYAELAGAGFPSDPIEQLAQAIAAVFRSWDAPKAAAYRRLKGLSDTAGTAVTVQAMVFGNAGGRSGAGVAFTRDPATGAPGLYFDFCPNGQGEDVVAGRRSLTDNGQLERLLPAVFAALQTVRARLEAEFRDVQDFEFTVQDGRLYLLQTRAAQRTPWAALRTAVDMVGEGLIAPEEALGRLADVDLAKLSRSRFPEPLPEPLAKATVAGYGVASGALALDAVAVQRLAATGQSVILVRPETITADIAGMAQVAGILTAAGSRTSHAAVVARQLGIVCLVGCETLTIDLDRRVCRIGSQEIAEEDGISLDGNTGAIYRGLLPVQREHPERELAVVAGWAATSRTTSEEDGRVRIACEKRLVNEARRALPGSG